MVELFGLESIMKKHFQTQQAHVKKSKKNQKNQKNQKSAKSAKLC
jgi:hypothetical protein